MGEGDRWRRVNYIGYKIPGETDKNVLELLSYAIKLLKNLKHRERDLTM